MRERARKRKDAKKREDDERMTKWKNKCRADASRRLLSLSLLHAADEGGKNSARRKHTHTHTELRDANACEACL